MTAEILTMLQMVHLRGSREFGRLLLLLVWVMVLL